jgi:hypothetical protein
VNSEDRFGRPGHVETLQLWFDAIGPVARVCRAPCDEAPKMPGLSRNAIRQQFESVAPLIEREPSDDWATVRHKLDVAFQQGIFEDESDT